jgi:hypothetical protein
VATASPTTYSVDSAETARGGRFPPVEFQLAANGGWTWFNDERSIVHNGATYVAFNAGGGGSGHMRAVRYDHTSEAITSGTITTSGSSNDHMNPGLIVLPSGILVAFYASHFDTLVRYRFSSSAEDVTSWGSLQTTPTTPYDTVYVNPRYLSGPDRVVLFSRCMIDSNRRTHVLSVSTDQCATFGSWVEWMRPTGNGIPYLVMQQVGDRLHMVISDTHPVSGQSSIYHCYAEWHTGDGALRFYKSDGTRITVPLPFAPSDCTLVFDGSTQRAWTWDITTDASGNPRVLFTKYPSNNGSDIRMMFSRWSGSAWTAAVDIVGASVGTSLYGAEAYYTGGACFDGNDPAVVYLAMEVTAGIYEMQKWRTSDAGATWSMVRALTSGTSSGQDNMRPVSPRNHHDKLAVVWMQGIYTTYTNWTTALRAANVAG